MDTKYQIRCMKGIKTNRVFVDGVELTPAASLKIRNHSPDGFSWGYAGSGPAQTALAICLHIFKKAEIASAVYQNFKYKFVGAWQGDEIKITIDITDFLIDNREHFPQ